MVSGFVSFFLFQKMSNILPLEKEVSLGIAWNEALDITFSVAS